MSAAAPRLPLSPADFGKLIATETEKWGDPGGEHQAGVIIGDTAGHSMTLSLVATRIMGQIRPKGEAIMKILLSIAATAAIMLDGAGAAAVELPTFELMGFPITRHQVAVLGAANVQERSPAPTLTLGGMPASAHQVRVLTPRLTTDGARAADLTEAGFSAP